MTQQEHLQRVLSDLRAKQKVAEMRATEQQTRAEAFAESAEVVEVELARFPKASTPAVNQR